jgi:hypothetical protein
LARRGSGTPGEYADLPDTGLFEHDLGHASVRTVFESLGGVYDELLGREEVAGDATHLP